MNVPTASVYCSRKRASAMASRNARWPICSVYHAGRGSDPVIVVGSMRESVAFIISSVRLADQNLTLRDTMANLGYVGLGAMGGNMADLLMAKGHHVTGYNRTAAKADWLVKKGMSLAASPKAVALAADVIFIMVTNSAADEAVMNGPDGLLAGLTPGKIIVDMSTVSPAISRGLAARVREKGGDMVDAPVSGSIVTLQQGKLSVMVGGHKATFDRIKPILDDVGPRVTHVGDNGLALVMKIATNLSLAVQMLAFSEGVLLAEKSGIPRATAVDVLIHSVADGRLSRSVRSADAGRGLVQREHDAEGHDARAGTRPTGRRPAANDR